MRSVPRASKSALACVVAAFALLVANRAVGQTGGTTGTSGTGGTTSLSSSDFTMYLEYYDKGQDDWVQMNTTQQTYFFNRARCECDGDTTGKTGYVKVAIKAVSTTGETIRKALTNNFVSGGFARIYATSSSYNCLSPGSYGFSLETYCLNLLDPTLIGYATGIEGGIAFFESNTLYESPPIPVAWLFGTSSSGVCGNGTSCDSTSTCTNATSSVIISFWAQTTSYTYPDMSDMSISLSTVGKVAYEPADVTAEGGNEALLVNWGWASDLSPSTDTNFLGVQLFCQRGESTQVFQDDSFEQRFMSSATLCPAVAPATSSGGLAQLDPKYLCSGLLPSTATSHRITGLQNGIPYGVGVAAVDKFYNVSAISNIAYATPIPTVDFYSEYRQDGGLAKGGYCTLVGRHGRPSVVAILCLAGLGLVLRRRRRSKRRRPGAGTLVILVVTGTLTAGQARAQRTSYGSSFEDSFGDSSDDSADAPPPAPADEADDEAAAAPADDASDDSFVDVPADEAWTGSPRNFAIEARFGLYTPNIDSEISGSGRRPQSFMFGSERRPMWQLEFDWEFLQTFGTLALGGVIGYYKESAKACYLSDLELTQKCNRSADDTSLRLIPVAALLIYRMDEVAERWRIPLVPYAKIGLNYTFWTVNNGDGNVPTYPNTGGSRGKGGTMGWQAAVGLSLRLDFLDPSGARTFDTESGVNHTYAFFELDHVDSSGLYRKDALRVGDDTWFTGLMFEF